MRKLLAEEASLQTQSYGETMSAEFSSFHVFIENFSRGVESAIVTSEGALRELRERWQDINWNADEQHLQEQLAGLHRSLGITINQLAHKDRELERYTHLLHKQFKHRKAQLTQTHKNIELIQKEIGREKTVEYDERTIHKEVREEEQRLHYILRKTAVSLRRTAGRIDSDAISNAYHVVEPILVRVEAHERKLLEDLRALQSTDRLAA